MLVVLLLALPSIPLCAEPVGYAPGLLAEGGYGLVQIDLTTGEVIEIGPFGPGFGSVALAFSPDGTLYGFGYHGDGNAQLAIIDPATGAATLVAVLSMTDPFVFFDSLAVDACGRFFASGEMGVFGGGLRDKVIELDPSTGSVIEVVSLPHFSGPRALAARGEMLFAVRQGVLSILDPATGEITPVGGTSVPPFDLDFSDDGFLWTVLGANPPFPPIPGPPQAPGTTFRIHPSTGEVTEVADVFHEVWPSVAIGPPPGACGAAVAIPASSPLGLLVLAALIAAGGVILARRARRPADAR